MVEKISRLKSFFLPFDKINFIQNCDVPLKKLVFYLFHIQSKSQWKEILFVYMRWGDHLIYVYFDDLHFIIFFKKLNFEIVAYRWRIKPHDHDLNRNDG